MRFIFPEAKHWWKVGLSLTSIVFIAGAWSFVTTQDRIKPIFLPKPVDVIREIGVQFSQNGALGDIEASLRRLSIAVVCGVLAAVCLGTVITLNVYLRAITRPIIYTFQFIPIAVFATLAIMALGIYESPKILFISFGVFMQLLPIVVMAIGQVEENFIKIGKCKGFSDWDLVRRVYLRRAAPQIFDGMRASLGLAWSFMVISEIITGDSGIGLQLEISRRYHHTATVFCFVLLIALMGLTTDFVVVFLRKRLFPWQTAESST